MQHRMHGTDRGQLDIVVFAADLLADLRRTPARVLPLDLQDELSI